MQLFKDALYDENYGSKIVKIETFMPHPNPEVTRLKYCIVPGTIFPVLVGIDYEPGYYVYFSVNSIISSSLLSFANLYRHSEMNKDNTKSGFFDDNGRVKAIKLKPVYDYITDKDGNNIKLIRHGCQSEGFLLPFNVFSSWIKYKFNDDIEEQECDGFNAVCKCIDSDPNDCYRVSWKYIIKESQANRRSSRNRDKGLKRYNKVIKEQFHFHYDTINADRIEDAIKPNDLVHMSVKVHGTSVCVARVLCKRELKWYEKLYNRFSHNKIPNTYYDNLYSSRKVIKNANTINGSSNSYYDCDIYKYANDLIYPHLDKGMEVYAEIVGYLPNGKMIQKNYDYGCIRPIDEYEYNTHYKVFVYRIELINEDGIRHEMSPREVQIWCHEHNLTPVSQIYYGYADEVYTDIKKDANWYINFINRLSEDTCLYMNDYEPMCINKVPREGIVIKVDNMKPNAYKVKCQAFLDNMIKELEQGITNIEDYE